MVSSAAVSNSIVSSLDPELELPPGLQSHLWGRAIWWKKHPDGPVLAVFHLFPLPFYVAGWIPFAGQRTRPRLVRGFEAKDTEFLGAEIHALGMAAYKRGPSEAMLERSKGIAKKYAENGAKGGRPKKYGSKKAPAKHIVNWQDKYPGWKIGLQKATGRLFLCAPNGSKLASVDIEKYAEGIKESREWWQEHGPTEKMVSAMESLLRA